MKHASPTQRDEREHGTETDRNEPRPHCRSLSSSHEWTRDSRMTRGQRRHRYDAAFSLEKARSAGLTSGRTQWMYVHPVLRLWVEARAESQSGTGARRSQAEIGGA